MIFLNNLAVLHSRDPYVDADSRDGPRRHLVRMWLRNTELSWEVPDSMRVPWEKAFGPDGNGIEETRKKYKIVPSTEYRQPRYTAGSAAFIIDDSEDYDSAVED
jgi:hypothetical protein